MPGKKPRQPRIAARTRRPCAGAGQAAPPKADHRLGLIAEVTESIAGSQSLARRAAEIAERVRGAFGVDACIMRLLENDELVLLAKAGVPAGTLFRRVPTTWGVTQRVLSGSKPVFIPDVRLSLETAPIPNHLRRPLPFVAYAGISLTAGGQVLGILGIYWDRPNPRFSESDRRCLQGVGHSVGAAIANQRLYEQVRAQKDEYRSELVQRRQAESALRESEERFRMAMDATTDGLWDWDTRTDRTHFSPGYYRLLGYEPNDFQMSGASWLEHVHPDDRERALKANQDCIENRTQEFEVEFRMRAKSGEWKWVCGRGKAARRDSHGRATRLVGTHVDITARKQAEEALRRSHQDYVRLSRDRQTLLEQERTRISRHLHDELGQSLTFLMCQLAHIEKRLRATDPGLAAELVEARTQTQAMIASVREVARSLRPIAIEHDGLIPSLRSSVTEFQRVSGVSSRLLVELGEQVIEEPLATTVYRVVQECLTNMARHANASGCEIHLLAGHGHLELTIRDNGRGAPPGALGGHRSLGIIGMKERAAAVGGKLSVQNHPRGGVIVRARFPLISDDQKP